MVNELKPSDFQNPSPGAQQHLNVFHKAQLDAIGEGILSINNSGIVVLADKIIREALGIFPGDDLAEVLPKLYSEAKLTFKDLRRRFVASVRKGDLAFLVMISPIQLGVDTVGAICVFVENSDLEKMTRQMRSYQELNKELVALINSSHEGLCITDAKGKILRLNPTAERLNDIRSEDVIGKNIQQLVKNGLFEDSVTAKAIEKREIVNLLRTKNGRKIIITATPVFDDDIELIRVVVSYRDVTEIDRLQSELEKKEALKDQFQHHITEIQQEEVLSDSIVAKSQCMVNVLKQTIKLSKVDSSVLILGESGVGKGLFADLIQQNSARSQKPMIKINCGAIPESLIEAELFGHEKGAFTGADSAKPGYLEMADGGILFLDEIAELPLSSQVKLLRFLEDGHSTRIGGTKSSKFNIRILAATHRNLEEMVEQGKFRLDLFYRLNVIPLRVPPLRDRKECILPLLYNFINHFGKKDGINKRLSRTAIDALLSYSYPGNVRELMNICERLVVMTESETIDLNDLPFKVVNNNIAEINETSITGNWSRGMTLQHALDNMEKAILTKSLTLFDNQKNIASSLGVNPSTISRKLIKYNLDKI
ncbi:sigma-54 interaction domain-containing protein [Desulforhopalus singaporensis]|uniref:PAS domain S-box-containing protein n=1 Tax=Desulforhopalus singaporensis TaxID=91360 RepID=A0A1H0VDH6_9BACT|nr:sigma 54-interacting transcriptional regulator [Desulforhopalus singaporensis]SDP76403.1 PAS domain S-box-containing protein [Desulforhopalus singaporensis]